MARRRQVRWTERWHFPESRPRPTTGGIKARSQRGAFAESWWGRRWLEVLESFDIGARLQRGRSYARRGQVVSLDIAPGRVAAAVQGSRPRPYEVKIVLKPIAEADWAMLAERLSARLTLMAKLLAGEMPAEVEGVFAEAGAPLFPAAARDLVTDCSCPDWSNPCKHIAAVYYLLGEEFDRDPFLLFQLRGKDRDAILALLASSAATATEEPAGQAPPPAEPVTADPRLFWQGGSGAAGAVGTLPQGGAAAPPVRQLGGFPFWRGEADFAESMDAACARAVALGRRIFLASAAAFAEAPATDERQASRAPAAGARPGRPPRRPR